MPNVDRKVHFKVPAAVPWQDTINKMTYIFVEKGNFFSSFGQHVFIKIYTNQSLSGIFSVFLKIQSSINKTPETQQNA